MLPDETPVRVLYQAVLSGDATAARAATEQGLASKIEPLRLINAGMIPAMEETGNRFATGEYFVPDLLIRARAMKTAMAILRPLLIEGKVKSLGRVVLGTVKGDVHDIGKNLVAAMLEGSGFEIIDLGTNVAPEKFVSAVKEHSPDIVALSALLTTTMYSMKTTVDVLRAEGVRQKVKVLVGGAPVTKQFAQEIGADGTSNNVLGAVVVAKMVLGYSVSSTAGVYLCTA